jgi:YD repeat-containing protein
LNNGAISLITDPSAQTRSMLSKLALEKISIKGFQGVASDSLPMYKFSYYDVSKSWWDLNQSTSLMKYQDDFGYYNSDTTGASPNPDTDRPVWSLKEITYPDGGRHFITYKSDSLNSLSVSYGKYIKSSAGHYNPDTTGNFQSLKQGGPRVKSITTYDGYSSNGYVVNFAYGPGRHWSIPEIWFRRNVFPTHLLFSGGERGQSAVTYDWIEKAFPDGSRIKTFYETGDGSPEPQMLYAYPGGGSKFVIIQGNTRWNWGDAKKVQYFAANGVISGNRVREEILNWSYRGQNGDTNPLIKVATVAPSLLYNSGAGSTPEYKLNFTSKRLDSKITKHIVAVATGIDSVTMTETYLYDADGTIMSSRTETSDDGKVRKTEYTYVRELNTVPSFTIDDTMQYRNMRTQMAQASLKDNANLGYSSTATTWRSVNHSGRTKYLPDKEFRWRNSTTAATIPSFNWTAPDTAKWPRAQTFLGYDAHGNLTRIHDAYAGETTVYWDSDATNSLIDSIQTRPNATTTLTTKYGYDPNTFRLTTMTDPNNQTSQYRYDPLQRLIEVINATKRTIANNRYFYSRQGAGSGDNFVTTNPNHVKTTASTHAEHVRNHDFENGSGPLPDSWNKAEIGTGLGTWDSAEKFSGAKSLKAYIPSAGAGNRVRWDAWYDEKISSKKTYRMEVWVKTDAADNGLAAFTLWVHDVNHNYLAAETRKMYLPNTSNVWKKYTLDFTPGISADHVYAIYLDLEPNGAGTIWYDRANFYELNTVKTFAMALAAIFKPCSAKDLARSSPEPSMTSPTGSPK